MCTKSFVDFLKVFLTSVFIVLITIFVSIVNKSFFGELQSVNQTETDEIYNENTVIIIDAGHGGEDGGAVSQDGTLEKDINLKIAQKLYYLFQLSDLTPVMTRTTDRMLYNESQSGRKKYYDLKNRIEFTNKFDNSLFLSIHQNKFPIEKYKGLQVYYSKNNSESLVLADIIQNNAKQLLDNNNERKSKRSNGSIFVLNNIDVPAVLVECGFMSNNQELEMLKDEEYQRKIAFTVFVSVMQYISQNE